MLPLIVKQGKTERLAEVQAYLHERLEKPEAGRLGEFVNTFYARVPPEDVLASDAATLYGAALSCLRFAARRRPGEARVRVYNPRLEEHGWKSTHSVVEIVTDDMPFIVDSVTADLQRRGRRVHLVIHPVITVGRDGEGRWLGLAEPGDAGTVVESIMHVAIDETGDAQEREALKASIEAVLADVRATNEDWPSMLARLDEILAELTAITTGPNVDEAAEAAALLAWLRNNHFTFLGVRDYAFSRREDAAELAVVPGSGLGILRDPERRVLGSRNPDGTLAPIVRQFFDRKELVLTTKTSVRGRVHRAVHMDYIGVKRYAETGEACGERRFVGLFTASAYSQPAHRVPVLRRRVQQVLQRSGFEASGHDGKALAHILDSYPRDELFQIDPDTLHEIAVGIHALQERPRIRLFARRDKFERYYSCLIYLPRERLSTDVRRRFERILVDSFNGRISNYYTQVGDSPLARLHVIVGTDPGSTPADVDFARIEARLKEAARSWHDDLGQALIGRFGEERGNRLAQRYGQAFPVGYQEACAVDLVLADVERLEALAARRNLAISLFRRIEDPPAQLLLKLYRAGQPIALSDILPVLEHFGLYVLREDAYRIRPQGGEDVWLHEFSMSARQVGELELEHLKPLFEAAFDQIFHGECDDDRFNRLVLLAGLDWREVAVLRAYAKYLRQAGIPYSLFYLEEALARHPALARQLSELFGLRFDPALQGDRADLEANKRMEIEAALEEVDVLDEDRILRRFLNVIAATWRTNYFQRDSYGRPKPQLAFKIDSQQVAELPLPRPMCEVWVYSPRVEGIHLRGGKVARGGIRWSDRREDFRTEVLGLMKAQMVKNAVIVPVGSKGGFFPKRPPTPAGWEAVLADGIACYKTFVAGLLDITDNLTAAGVLPPADVVRHDGDDPYLVVAADKGTATFSDIANGLAKDYGFWLGDAFASGGGAGYDHKKMAITSRGAWEAAKRHFRELGRDIEAEPFSAIGIGDMSGDVFGNGMLRSRTMRLLAAFDHRDIFVDPDPDPERSFQERQRLFDLPRSSWQDYDRKLVSKGGGVFSRTAKAIPLSAELRALTGLAADQVTPNELCRALLLAPADLLWKGGIGTFVKASDEPQAAAGDRANDAIRVDGGALRFQVVAEGGNLGFTQAGRIEYARKGGRINTDAIDNSAGVDCSDHEVNIKILLGAVQAEGELTERQRNRLLAEMTDEVAALVLRDNYLQTQALTLLQSAGAALNPAGGRLMRQLERVGKLDRAVEGLPDDAALAERTAADEGLTRPELAVLLAYAKMWLYDQLLASDLVDSEHLEQDLVRYFPRLLRKRFPEAIRKHRLRREIIATVTANSIVNRVGFTFVHDMVEASGESVGNVARAYALARDAFSLRPLWNAIEALDGRVPAELQQTMLGAGMALLRRASLWFLRNLPQPIRLKQHLPVLVPAVEGLTANWREVLSPGLVDAVETNRRGLCAGGVPAGLAERVALLAPLGALPDIVEAARGVGRDVASAGRLYFALGAKLGLDRLAQQAGRIVPTDQWQATAADAIVEDLNDLQRHLSGRILRNGGGLEAWCQERAAELAKYQALMQDLRAVEQLDIARLTVANRALGRLARGSAS
ncbi:MAG: NAD-glutamate dehydrogenase [Alphaproteobacteria bacterium]|nr:NAD-glutamate dehydrogenase [Alphaproteobacteria bacterium]